MPTLTVELGSRSYPIQIEHGNDGGFSDFVRTVCPNAHRVMAIADTNTALIAQQLLRDLPKTELKIIPSGEQSKSVTQLAEIWSWLAVHQTDRKTPLIAIGGGVIGDLGGFAAASYNRGIPLIMVPTTLLSMVDSSVGGKTGINIAEGKNLVGAFHQPRGVWINSAHLEQLPDREFRSGLAEVIKYGMILDADFFSWLESNLERVLQRDAAALTYIISRSCELKAHVVQNDEFETSGLRMVLNYGHTFGHAFESIGGYGSWLHGEAIAAGMMCAAELAVERRMLSSDIVERQRRLLEACQLPLAPKCEWDIEQQLQVMRRDKKNVGGKMRFILPEKIGRVVAIDDVSESSVTELLKRLAR